MIPTLSGQPRRTNFQHLVQRRAQRAFSRQVGQSEDWCEAAARLAPVRLLPFSAAKERGALAATYADAPGVTIRRATGRYEERGHELPTANESKNAVSGWAEPEEGHKSFGGARVKSSESSGDSACESRFARWATRSPALRYATVRSAVLRLHTKRKSSLTRVSASGGCEGVFPAARLPSHHRSGSASIL